MIQGIQGELSFPPPKSNESGGAKDRLPPVAGGQSPSRRGRIIRSALWAAYGDALGWISEMTDQKGLKRRINKDVVEESVAWKRKIGGMRGVIIDIPAGCYSDDSQLRLATGRAISSYGFDVEAFAKVEIPVWLGYKLGGGRATSIAAKSLRKKSAKWFCNRYDGWFNAGGNGAAMRIQPHVWAARSPEDATSFLLDVFRDTICTHSHPVGIMGAVLHALSLAHAMVHDSAPSPESLLEATEIARDLPELIKDDMNLQYHWLPEFEQAAGNFEQAWEQVVGESKGAIQAASKISNNRQGAERYDAIIEQLHLRKPELRGSGLHTAIAAVALTWCVDRAEQALPIAANALGTDTDTIVSMAGAIYGAVTDTEPQGTILDKDLFLREAGRLASIAAGKEEKGHTYPDLLHWKPPATNADILTQSSDGTLWVRGLGAVREDRAPIQTKNPDYLWQWFVLQSGQTLLIRRRRELRLCPEQEELSTPEIASQELNLEKAIAFVREYVHDNKKVGQALRKVVGKGTDDQIDSFVNALVDELRQADKRRCVIDY